MFLLYNIFLFMLTPLLLLFFLTKKRSFENITALSWRLGKYPASFLPSPSIETRIWIHAASVGEVNAIIPFVKMLREHNPLAWIALSVMTDSGLKMAQEHLPEIDQHFLAPFDLFFAARRAMRKIHPSLFITAETEIWPNLVKYAQHNGGRILMINGRISPRSIAFYKKFRGFFGRVLAYYDCLSVILQDDAERLIQMGAPSERVVVNGNIKYDRLAQQFNPDFLAESKEILNLTGTEKVLVAGSTREGEESLILEAFSRIKDVFPDLMLIIAPRHLKRVSEVSQIIKDHGYKPVLRTDIQPHTQFEKDDVILLNTMGELYKIYSVATLAFCGASLVPLGGQNPLEPASWSKVVLYGPSMEDFADAKLILEKAGAGFEVQDPEGLAKKAIELLHDPGHTTQLGETAKEMVLAQQGSAQRNIDLAIQLLKGGIE